MDEPLKPLLAVIFDALKERGWTIKDGGYIDPEGNVYLDLENAVRGQSIREIALGQRPSAPPPE